MMKHGKELKTMNDNNDLPVCDLCGVLMEKEQFVIDDDSDFRYCSKECAEVAYTDSLGE